MKRLAFIPFLVGIIAVLGMLLETSSGSIYHRVVLILVALTTACSAFVTARYFAREDRLFACWSLIGAGYSLSAIRYVLRVITMLSGTTFNQTMLNAMLIFQNLAIAIALFLFVRAWQATGLAAPGSRATRTLSIVAGIVVAIVVGGYPLARGFANASTDVVLFVSTLGDMVGIALIVPLALSALAMRGGLLMHTWVYLAASEAVWLVYDIWYAVRPSMLPPNTVRGIEEGIRVVAILVAFAATVAQRRAIRA
jgi:hypothetical protein